MSETENPVTPFTQKPAKARATKLPPDLLSCEEQHALAAALGIKSPLEILGRVATLIETQPGAPARNTGPHVYAALSDALGDFAKVGLAKTRENVEQKFNFRGIDELMNVAAPIFARHRLLILPHVVERVVTERIARSGSTMFNVALLVEFFFVSAVDGSQHSVRLAGEATDTGDKATNKAMSAAFKYCLLQSFCIPLEGEGDDADAHTNEPSIAKPPTGYDAFLARATEHANKGLAFLRAQWKQDVNEGKGALWVHLIERDAENWKLISGKATDEQQRLDAHAAAGDPDARA